MNRKSLSLVILAMLAVAALPVCAKKKAKNQDPEQAPQASESTGPVAVVAGEPISLDEVDALVRGQLMKLRQEEYETRRRALDYLVDQKLLEKEAAARGISLEELMKTEIEAKITEPTQQEIENFYNANKDRNRNLAGKTLEQATPIIEQMLRQQRLNQRRQAFLQELRAKTQVAVYLDPPRVDIEIPEGEPALGPADAPVTIVEFSDYQCPYCRRAEPTVERILKEYEGKVRLVYRDYPLRFHPRAMPAAIAARCAGDQGKYWDYHNDVMKNAGNLSDDDLKARAQKLGLDMTAFNACYDNKQYEAMVQASFEKGAELGVTGTPTFFINGRRIVGAKPYEEFKSIIEEELQRHQAGESRTGG